MFSSLVRNTGGGAGGGKGGTGSNRAETLPHCLRLRTAEQQGEHGTRPAGMACPQASHQRRRQPGGKQGCVAGAADLLRTWRSGSAIMC